ncbi:MAG: TetR/AcrR family transcriptional regulator [Polyangiales bacterium]
MLDAAARAFARGGYHATTMQDIAREAGYTPPSLYVYFEGKEQIFVELATLLSREFMAAFSEPMPAEALLPERLEILLTRLFATADRYRDAVTTFMVARLSGETLLSQGMTSGTNQGAHFSSVSLLTSWLRANTKRGELGERRLEDLGVALAGLAHAFCIQWLSEGKDSAATTVSRIVPVFLYGALGEPRSAKTTRSRER